MATTLQTQAPPATLDGIAQTLAQLQHEMVGLRHRLDAWESLAHEGKQLAAMAGDTLDDHAAHFAARGVDVEARALQVLSVLEAATAPELLDRVESLLRRTHELASVLQTVGELPGLVATAADAFDTMVAGLQARGIDLDQRLHALLTAMDHLSSPAALQTLNAVFGVSPTDDLPPASAAPASPLLALLLDATAAVQEAQAATVRGQGLFATLRAAGEPEVQAATGLLVGTARALGRRILARTKRALP